MDEDTAKQAIDFAAQLGIRKVAFCGGEPLLNFDLIKKAVEYGKGKDMEFGITTNGTIVTDEIADFCKEHNIKVSVDLDGPKEVHDLCRVYPDGRGTYDDVIRGIKKLSERGVLTALEITYSAKHSIDLRRSIDFVAAYSKVIACAPVRGPAGSPYEDEIVKGDRLRRYYRDMLEITIDYALKARGIYLSGIREIVAEILSPSVSSYISDAMVRRLAIFSDGDMYPCPETMKKEYCLGNIGDENSIKNFGGNRKRILSMFSRERLLPYWFANIADICVVRMEFSNDGRWHIVDAETLSESIEDIIYKLTEVNINELVEELNKCEA